MLGQGRHFSLCVIYRFLQCKRRLRCSRQSVQGLWLNADAIFQQANKDWLYVLPVEYKSRWFRYGFLTFFLIMFLQMLWNTYLVFTGVKNLKQAVTLLWTFKLPWHWAYHGTIFHPGAAQFAFGFYSVMLTSTVLGLITMALFKPRSWCVYCPMGTMTQLICRARHHKSS